MRDSSNLEYVPVIIPEGGTEPSYEECSNHTQHVVDKMTLPFTGIAGFNTWGGWKHGRGKRFLHPKNDYNVEAVEMQAYISSNKELVVGYIRNRTHNVYTKGQSGTDCDGVIYAFESNGDPIYVSTLSPINQLHLFKWNAIQKDKRIKVTGLLNGKKYNIDFYSQNQWITDNSKYTTLSGKLKLRYPFFEFNRPVIWFVAKREGYNGMIQNNEISEDAVEVFSENLLVKRQDTLSQKSLLNVHPNPFRDYLTIESVVDDEILIQDPSGRIILKQKISTGKNRIQTERLTNGIYFIHFEKQSQTFKIIKR